jgi:hypothetical protein
MHKISRGIALVLILISSTLLSPSQVPPQYEGVHDKDGYRHGWFLDYWDEDFNRVTKPAKAVYTTRSLYAHGVKLTLYNTLPKRKGTKQTFYKVLNDSLVKMEFNSSQQSPLMLDGKYVSYNKEGKLASTFQFKDGIAVGTFILMDSKCDHVDAVQEFYPMEQWDTMVYELKNLQVGTGTYMYYYQYKKLNGIWSYCSKEDDMEKMPYHLIVFPDNRPNNFIAHSEIIVNDSILIKMGASEYCSFYLDNPNVKIRMRNLNTELHLNIEQPQSILSLHLNMDAQFTYKMLDEEIWEQVKRVRKLKCYSNGLRNEGCFPFGLEKRRKWS